MGNLEKFPNAIACKGGFWEVTVADVRTMDKDVRQIDVRESGEFVGDMGLLPNVEHVPMNAVETASEAWDKEEPIVIICRSGGRSATAALQLQKKGFTNVTSLRGGMIDWNRE